MDIPRLQHGLHQHHLPVGRDVGAAPSLALKPHLDSPTSVASPSSMSAGHGHGHTHTYPRHPAPHSHNHDAESLDYRELSDERSPVNGDEPSRKKQKRNKPTLSCHECVERKTKVCFQNFPSDETTQPGHMGPASERLFHVFFLYCQTTILESHIFFTLPPTLVGLHPPCEIHRLATHSQRCTTSHVNLNCAYPSVSRHNTRLNVV